MSSERVLITGVTGFLGRNVAKYFLDKGYNVSGIGRNMEVGRELEEKGVDFLCADICKKISIEETFENIDYVVHSAALSSPWGRYSDFYNTNVIGTKNVLECSKENNAKKFIHISTPSIYFDFKDREMISEDSKLPKKLCNHYAGTKCIAENLVDKAHLDGLFTVTLRPRAIFGIGDNAIFPRLIKANNKIGVPLINGGNNLVDITSVENVVHAVYLAIKSQPKANGEKFNITNDEPMKFKDLISVLFESLHIELKSTNLNYRIMNLISLCMELVSNVIFLKKVEPMFTRYSIGVLAKTQTLDISKAKRVLGYKPIISTKESIIAFGEAWRNKVYG